MPDGPPTSDPTPVRDRLLNAAEQVVARDGVQNLTLEAVARQAGVSKGGLLYHFPSKSELITAIVERLATHCDTEQAQALATTPHAPGAFTRAYLSARSSPLDPHETPLHAAILAAAGTDPQYLAPFRQRVAEWQDRLHADGIDPANAEIVRLAIDGLCLLELLGMPAPTGDFRQKILDQLVQMTTLKGPRDGKTHNPESNQITAK